VTARELELLRVVIVDDQSRVRAGFRMILESEDGIEVASDGEEAVRAVRQTRPDLVLMDIRMPGPDGLEATGGSDGLRDRPGAAGT
jgi:YesN/AraC family two-component response regulator